MYKNNKNRNMEIDIAKGIGMFLVVYGHFIFYGDELSQHVRNFIYSFHMPLFFFISGFLYKKSAIKSTFKKVSEKFIIPTYLLVAVDVLLCFILNTDRGGNLPGKEDILNTLLVTGGADGSSFVLNDPIWYLMAISVILVVKSISVKSKKIEIAIDAFVVSLLIAKQIIYPGNLLTLSWYFSWMFGYVFFEFGCYYRLIKEKQLNLSKMTYCIILAIEVLLLIGLSYYNGLCCVAASDFGKSLVVSIITGLFGVHIVISLSKWIKKYLIHFAKLFANLGEHSLFVLITHAYFTRYCNFNNALIGFFLSCCVVLLELCVVYLLRKATLFLKRNEQITQQ